MVFVQKIEERVRREPECLLSHGEVVRYKSGQDLFYQGHDPCGLYWIQRGSVSLIHANVKGERAASKTEGEILGLPELLNQEAFPYTAQAATDCEVCFIPKIIFLDWLKAEEK